MPKSGLLFNKSRSIFAALTGMGDEKGSNRAMEGIAEWLQNECRLTSRAVVFVKAACDGPRTSTGQGYSPCATRSGREND